MWEKWKIPIPNYLSCLKNQNLYVKVDPQILRQFGDEFPLLKKSTKYYRLSSGVTPLDYLLDLLDERKKNYDEVFQNISEFKSRSKKGVRLPQFLDSKLAYLVGVLRDGSVSKLEGDRYTIALTQSGNGALQWIQLMRDIFNEIFLVEAKIDMDKNSYRLRVNSKPIVLFFENIFEMPMDQKYWKTPRIIKENPKCWKYYLAGFFDAEGYVTSKQTYKKIRKIKLAFYQSNLESLQFIKKILKEVGIRTSHIYSYKNKFALYIYGINNFYKFKDFPIIRKKKDMESLYAAL